MLNAQYHPWLMQVVVYNCRAANRWVVHVRTVAAILLQNISALLKWLTKPFMPWSIDITGREEKWIEITEGSKSRTKYVADHIWIASWPTCPTLEIGQLE